MQASSQISKAVTWLATGILALKRKRKKTEINLTKSQTSIYYLQIW